MPFKDTGRVIKRKNNHINHQSWCSCVSMRKSKLVSKRLVLKKRNISMIKGSIHRKDLRLYLPNNIATKY
jgi:hypothetical protein